MVGLTIVQGADTFANPRIRHVLGVPVHYMERLAAQARACGMGDRDLIDFTISYIPEYSTNPNYKMWKPNPYTILP